MHGLPPRSLVEKHLGIVEKFAAQYRWQKPAGGADLRAAGALGLCEAAERFRPRKGAAFSTYAWNWVKGAVLSELRRAHVVPVPEHTARKAAKSGSPIRGVVKFARNDAAFDQVDDDAPDSESAADLSMRRRALHEAIAELDNRVHRLVIKRTLAGRTVEQIAKGMGVAEARVEELLDEARAELAWLLA
jgi:RNA polymerase sigma factor (sigma-70 family)